MSVNSDSDPARAATPEPPHRTRVWMAGGRRALPPLFAAGAALAVSQAVPLLGPLLVAMAMGVVVANTPRLGSAVTRDAATWNRRMLRAGVVLLGLKISVSDLVGLGGGGIVVVVLTVTTTFALTEVAGWALKVPRPLATLIAAGFAICGAAAIAALGSSIRAKAQDVALAVALVTIFGTAMIAIVPALAQPFGLTDEQSAVWAGASIHEVAQVIAAASLIPGEAAMLAVAITVKLGRVTLLAPTHAVATRLCQEELGGRATVVPLFLVGFAACVALRSSGVLSATMLDAASALTTVLLSAAMFGLGTGIVARNLWPVQLRAVVLAGVSTAVAAGASLALTVVLV